MKPSQMSGIGLIIGAVAAGVLLAFVGLRWQETNFIEKAAAGTETASVQSTPGASGPSSPSGAADVAAGQTVFNQQCSSCHTIGGGKKVGPDLKGVTSQRPHDWLVSFIVDPQKVVSSGDPVATQLVSEYGGMVMPTLGISQSQAESLLAYIQQQSGQ